MWVEPSPAPSSQHSELDENAAAVIAGLSRPRKTLPCSLLYDAWGSTLFEAITRLPEYYPTRTETAILKRHAAEMTADISPGAALIEFGSGSSTKTELLLAQARDLGAYVPVDVSASALDAARQRLAVRFPDLKVWPVLADFTRPMVLPPAIARRRKVGFFPGSTIGNFTPAEAARWLFSVRELFGASGHLILGVDLEKDARRLIAAYDDAEGVTAAFNLNLLRRINRELGADFDLTAFEHRVVFDPREGRIEMHLVARREQVVRVCGQRFGFAAGETIHTESSYKYAPDRFRDVAAAAGWRTRRVWTDPEKLFSVVELA